jgi:glucose/arabinose dehydrogenase
MDLTRASAALVFFMTPLLLGAAPMPESPLGCPAAKTETRTPAGEPIVLPAKGTLDPVRIAGPFDQPRSVAFLPDGKFLVAERPGHLKLVGPGDTVVEI